MGCFNGQMFNQARNVTALFEGVWWGRTPPYICSEGSRALPHHKALEIHEKTGNLTKESCIHEQLSFMGNQKKYRL
jgi:hypothetical protein